MVHPKIELFCREETKPKFLRRLLCKKKIVIDESDVDYLKSHGVVIDGDCAYSLLKSQSVELVKYIYQVYDLDMILTPEKGMILKSITREDLYKGLSALEFTVSIKKVESYYDSYNYYSFLDNLLGEEVAINLKIIDICFKHNEYATWSCFSRSREFYMDLLLEFLKTKPLTTKYFEEGLHIVGENLKYAPNSLSPYDYDVLKKFFDIYLVKGNLVDFNDERAFCKLHNYSRLCGYKILKKLCVHGYEIRQSVCDRLTKKIVHLNFIKLSEKIVVALKSGCYFNVKIFMNTIHTHYSTADSHGIIPNLSHYCKMLFPIVNYYVKRNRRYRKIFKAFPKALPEVLMKEILINIIPNFAEIKNAIESMRLRHSIQERGEIYRLYILMDKLF